jgi:hypothetical protein
MSDDKFDKDFITEELERIHSRAVLIDQLATDLFNFYQMLIKLGLDDNHAMYMTVEMMKAYVSRF